MNDSPFCTETMTLVQSLHAAFLLFFLAPLQETVKLRFAVSRGRGTTVYVATLPKSGTRDAILRSACDALRAEMHSRNRPGLMSMYDDQGAAEKHDRGVSDMLSKEEAKTWESHRIAEYTWNRKTGYDACTYFPAGTGGNHPKMTTIKY